MTYLTERFFKKNFPDPPSLIFSFLKVLLGNGGIISVQKEGGYLQVYFKPSGSDCGKMLGMCSSDLYKNVSNLKND